jgi:hypothetical protein
LNYIEQLESLLQKYYLPFKKVAEGMDTEGREALLEDLDFVFGTIRQSILPFNKPFKDGLFFLPPPPSSFPLRPSRLLLMMT